MKSVNLKTIINIKESCDPTIFEEFLKYNKIVLNEDEFGAIKVLLELITPIDDNIKILNDFYIGFTIPQISKEFDLLKINKENVVNIELKSSSTLEKIKNQLIQNKHYLKVLKRKVHNITFISSTRTLFKLNEDDEIIEIKITELLELLRIDNPEETQIKYLFDPTMYLISPFNSTEYFIDNKYFLTNQQSNFKREIIQSIKLKNSSLFISITGRAGTGKTLLTYDIAKEAINDGKRVLIIHCGKLNQGHIKLNKDLNWNIEPIVFIKQSFFNSNLKYDLIIVDEAQRIFIPQLELIINTTKQKKGVCIFSYDAKQYLRDQENINNVNNIINTNTDVKSYELSSKIRSNKEIATFISALFNQNKPFEKQSYPNVELNYYENTYDAKECIEVLVSKGWKTINYTPSKGRSSPYDDYNVALDKENAHSVIGQEFDKVIAVIDSHFYYNNGELSIRNYNKKPYYNPTKMLYQIVTRTRKRLNIIIINNPLILERCLQITKIE